MTVEGQFENHIKSSAGESIAADLMTNLKSRLPPYVHALLASPLVRAMWHLQTHDCTIYNSS